MLYVPSNPTVRAYSSMGSLMSILTGPICLMLSSLAVMAAQTAIQLVITGPSSGKIAMTAVTSRETKICSVSANLRMARLKAKATRMAIRIGAEGPSARNTWAGSDVRAAVSQTRRTRPTMACRRKTPIARFREAGERSVATSGMRSGTLDHGTTDSIRERAPARQAECCAIPVDYSMRSSWRDSPDLDRRQPNGGERRRRRGSHQQMRSVEAADEDVDQSGRSRRDQRDHDH